MACVSLRYGALLPETAAAAVGFLHASGKDLAHFSPAHHVYPVHVERASLTLEPVLALLSLYWSIVHGQKSSLQRKAGCER